MKKGPFEIASIKHPFSALEVIFSRMSMPKKTINGTGCCLIGPNLVLAYSYKG
jgi:hypothetical protein